MASIQTAIDSWLATGQDIANAIGPWDEQSLPPLPAGHARVTALTPAVPTSGKAPQRPCQQTPWPAHSSPRRPASCS